MNDLSPNLFNALFKFHPREGHTPKENFLSEAFAYVLKTCDTARGAWLSLVLGRQVHTRQFELSTRQTEYDEAHVAIFPDMRIRGVLDDGYLFDLYSEHKWNSPCDSGQLRKYLEVVAKRGQHCAFAFVGARRDQKRDAESSDPRMKGKAFLWADLFQVLEPLPNKPDILVQFLDFMKTHGLSPGTPIQPPAMVAFIQSAGFLDSLLHCANKLSDDFEWDFIPKRYRSDEGLQVTDQSGRVAIEFATPAWKPTITIGFLYDEYDHEVSFINRQKGIDLLLRIETAPTEQKNIAPARAELDRRRKLLLSLASSVLLLGDHGNGNPHSLLMVRSCLGDVIEKATSQQAQLDAIYQTVSGWGKALFSDGTLEKAFKRAGLDSGM
jgi:hypothetical protein